LAAPLKTNTVGLLDLAKKSPLWTRALPKVCARLRYLLHLSFGLRHRDPEPHSRLSRLTCADAFLLARDGIIHAVTAEEELRRPSASWARPFTVVESRAGSDGLATMVRRFILWTETANDRINARLYEPQVDLKHISAYTSAVLQDVASLRDFKLGFWQVPIPEAARDQFRFRDNEGCLYEMTRLPMGMTTAPEIMQIISSVVAGDPLFVRGGEASRSKLHVWIDGFRFVGAAKDVQRDMARVDAFAQSIGIEWKTADSRDAVKTYDFLGLHWDHACRQVALTTRNAEKLPTVVEDVMSLADLEKLLHRLIYASGALNIPLAHFYWAMKVCRRKLNALNHGAPDTDKVHLSMALRTGLTRWIQCTRVPLTVVSHPGQRRRSVLFSDASAIGWGAVLILSSQELFVAGDVWRQRFTPEEINKFEAHALNYALQAFSRVLAQSGDTDVTIVVDNTSVQAGVRRGHAKSAAVNEALIPVLRSLQQLHCEVRVAYIASKDNPADSISRGRPLGDLVAIGEIGQRMGGGGDALRFSPLRNTPDGHAR
jgi:hypothetical protein